VIAKDAMEGLKGPQEGWIVDLEEHEPGQGGGGKGQAGHRILRPGKADEDSNHAPAERQQIALESGEQVPSAVGGFEEIVEDPGPAPHLDTVGLADSENAAMGPGPDARDKGIAIHAEENISRQQFAGRRSGRVHGFDLPILAALNLRPSEDRNIGGHLPGGIAESGSQGGGHQPDHPEERMAAPGDAGSLTGGGLIVAGLGGLPGRQLQEGAGADLGQQRFDLLENFPVVAASILEERRPLTGIPSQGRMIDLLHAVPSAGVHTLGILAPETP
jgi:hypothetical protein